MWLKNNKKKLVQPFHFLLPGCVITPSGLCVEHSCCPKGLNTTDHFFIGFSTSQEQLVAVWCVALGLACVLVQVRLNQLMKQQERLLRESEATVARRETIILRREAMAHSSHKQTSKGELKRLTQGLQRRIQDTNKVGDVHFCI